MKKIACIGTHSVGKSTFSYQLASQYKAEGENVYVLQERVRFSPFPIHNAMVYETAIWTCTSQISKELEAVQKGFSFLVCDRTSFDPFIYAEYFGLKSDFLVKDMAVDWLRTYDEIYFVRPGEDHKAHDDGVRSVDLDFIYAIDKMFYDFLNDNGIDFKTIYTEDIFDVRDS